jgi:hypothetical protein
MEGRKRVKRISYPAKTKAELTAMKRRRAGVLITSLLSIILLAWLVPRLVSAYWHISSRSALSYNHYQPRDFERQAYLAGQRLGSEAPDLPPPMAHQLYSKDLKKRVMPEGAKQSLKEFQSLFEVGYREAKQPKGE